MSKKRNIIILVVLLTIGFAAVSTTLVLNGLIGISVGELDVYYSRAVINDTEDNTVIKDKTHIDFNTTMTLVGEKYVMNYDVTNGSKNYDARISMNCKYETEDGGEYLSLNNIINTDDLLEAMTTRTGILTIKMIKAVTEPKDIHITCELSAKPIERDKSGGDEITKEPTTLVETILSKANDDSIQEYNAGEKGEVYAFRHDATEQLGANTDYRYIGSSPNNYITFDNETWRIIGVFKDENGTKRAKIVRDNYAYLPYQSSSNAFYWNDPRDRLNQSKPSYLTANTNWGDSDLYNQVVKRNITDDGLEHVDEVKYYLGASSNLGNSSAQFYEDERSNTTYSSIINPNNGSTSPNAKNMTGKVGLMYASDYFYTYANGVDDVCFNSPANCKTRYGGNPESSWLKIDKYYQEHLINNYANGNTVFIISPWDSSQYQMELKSTTELSYVREVVYLKSDTISESGDGSKDNPYFIESHDTKDYISTLKNEKLVDSSKIEKITFVNSNEVPENAKVSWDASAAKNGSIMAYTLDDDGNDMFELYIGKKGKVYTYYYLSSLFEFENAKVIDGFENFSTKYAYEFYNMFINCGVEKLDLRSFDTSMADTTKFMFRNCANLKELNVDGWDTSSLRDIQGMFWGCKSLKKLDLSSWDTSNVTLMKELFVYSPGFEEINLHGWNTSKVTDMSLMFDGCTNLKKVDVSTFDTSNVTSMMEMFECCENLVDLDLSNFDTRNVRNMFEMFFKCYKLKNLNIGNFIYNYVDADHLFSYCYDLTTTISIPNSSFNKYDKIFLNTSTNPGAQLKILYTSNSESFIDYLLSQKDSYPESVGIANVVKYSGEDPTTITKGDFTIEDNDSNGSVSKNDTLIVGTERFYIYDISDKVKAISANNLVVGSECKNSTCTEISNPSGLQYIEAASPKTKYYGVTPFADETYHGTNYGDYSGSLAEKYVNDYKDKLSSMSNSIDSVRLITKQELLDLGCEGSTCSSSVPSYIYSSNYWTMTPNEQNASVVYMMVWQGGTSGGLYSTNYDYKTTFGIRPVIELNKSIFE